MSQFNYFRTDDIMGLCQIQAEPILKKEIFLQNIKRIVNVLDAVKFLGIRELKQLLLLEKKFVNHYWVKLVKIVGDGLEKKLKLKLNICTSIKLMDWLQNVIYAGIKKQLLMNGQTLVELIKEICRTGDNFASVVIGNTTIQKIDRRSYGL